MARRPTTHFTTALLMWSLTVLWGPLPAVLGKHDAPFFSPDCTRDCSWSYIYRSVNETLDGVLQRQLCELTTSDPNGLTEQCLNPFRPVTDPNKRPGRPQHFRVTDFNKNISSSNGSSEVEQYTCARITFNLEPIAVNNVKGLQLRLEPQSIEDLNKNFCVNLNFSQAGLNYFAVLDKDQNKADLTFSCFCGLKPGRIYAISVRTMPVDIIGSSPHNTIETITHTPPGCSDATKWKDIRCQKSEAAQWQPRCISFKQDISTPHHKGDYNTIELSFDTAPESYCLDVYDVFVYPAIAGLPHLDYDRVNMALATTVNRTCSELNKKLPFVEIHFNATKWPRDTDVYVKIHPHSKACKSCRNAEGRESQCSNTFTKDFSVIEDPCRDTPCGIHGECISIEERYHCECAPGFMVWQGKCIADPCQSGRNFSNPCGSGECSYTSQRDDYVCYCNQTFLNVGKTCLADPCSEDTESNSAACGAHGRCNRTVTKDTVAHECICDPGYSIQNENYCEEDTTLAWFVIIISCIAGLLVLILLFCLGRRLRLFRREGREDRIDTSSRLNPQHITYTVIPSQHVQEAPEEMEISSRHVLPIFSEDHPRHKDVVIKFCRFLHRHLKCEVSLIDWQSHIGPTVEMWLAKEIEKADIVLLLCSKGTGVKYNARAKNDPLPINSESEYGDVFIKALTLLDDYFGRNNADEKFVVGYFDYSSADDIPVTFRRFARYRLMQYMEGLCLRIHGKVRDSPRSSRHIPSLKRYQDLEMGRPLYDAIEAMKETIRGDEFWFENDRVELMKAPSFFFDTDTSGEESDVDNYEVLESQLHNTLPYLRGDEGLYVRPDLHKSHPARSSSSPMNEFISPNFESVEDSSGYMSLNAV